MGANDAGETFFEDLKIEDLKRWRDRILEAIDTGIIIRVKSLIKSCPSI